MMLQTQYNRVHTHDSNASTLSWPVLDTDYDDAEELFITHRPRHVLYEEYGWNEE